MKILTIAKWFFTKTNKILKKSYLKQGLRLLIKHLSCLTGAKRKNGRSLK